jgi:hypothetical protein
MFAVKTILLLICACLAACQTTQPIAQATELAIENVTVIDPESRKVLPRRTIHVAGGGSLPSFHPGSARLSQRPG